MAARIIAMYMQSPTITSPDQDNNLNNKNNVKAFSMLCKCDWEQISVYDPETGKSEHEEMAAAGVSDFSAMKNQVMHESLAWLHQALLPHNPPSNLITIENYRQLLGMIDMNTTDVEAEPSRNQRAALKRMFPNRSLSDLPRVIGSGLFSLHACLNHSCSPNACVVGGLEGVGDARIRVEALQNITPGQEILICYTDPNLSAHHRRKHLMGSYLFLCNCHRCVPEQLTKNKKR